MPRAGHRDRSTASIDHRHRKIPPAFASNHLRSIRHYGIRMESERRRIGEVLRSIQLRQKDRDARWTVKYTKAKPREDGSTPPVDLAIPVFGYQNHISLDRGFGFIRKWSATDAAAYEGRRLRDGLLDKTNTGSVWADTAYRSVANEEFMERNGFVSHAHRKRPKGRPMPEAIRRAPTTPNQKSVRASSISSPSRRIGWVL